MIFAITGLLAFFAVLLCVAFVGQLASIFTAFEVRTTVTLGEYGSADFTSILSKYQEDSGIKSSWDRMQMDMRCCGGLGELDGYLSYQNTPMGLVSSKERTLKITVCFLMNFGNNDLPL